MTAMPAASPNTERAPVRGADPDELDAEAVQVYLAERLGGMAEGEWTEQAMRAGLLVKVGTSLAPTAVGLLCFGGLPQLWQPSWSIGAVRVRGQSLADPLVATETLEGPLPALLAGGLAFVDAHTHRVDDQLGANGATSEYPRPAVEEALLNALIHRDLRHPGRVGLQIFDRHLVIRSPGSLPNGVPALDEMSVEGGESIPRNPLLAATARRLGLGEQIGRGLAVIRRTMSAATREPARIVATASEVRVILPSALVGREAS